ncbi:hypothetical protein KI659_14945 [Litoribacter alkaliphilus]|uniref:Uncharacterized protein n=1 Tax=Litoribacter ruber TaxID=702568 RepID=A0AAP2CKD9_9BACT|nr:hypothetical protein [Litoribacter alkaliphilus]MBS9525314.1 hypothetical protein [Litoribacter alkaliphilus]
MKKLYLFVILFSLGGVLSNLKAQVTFSHSAGVFSTNLTSNIPAGLAYSPRVNFLELTDESTLSFGTHLGLGITGGWASDLLVDVPLVVEYNFGHASSPYSDALFGGFVGLGYDYMHIESLGDEPSTLRQSIHGPMVNAGIRAIVLEVPFMLRAAYTLNLNDHQGNPTNVLVLGLLFNLN